MTEKLYSIQYLRGLAALLVVVAHAWDHPMTTPNMDASRLGLLGVVIFFVISGFIMVAISGEGKFSALDFLKRRIIRVVPLYWIFTSLAALLALLLPALFKSTIFTWPHYLQSLLFIPHEAPGRGGSSPLLSLGWTLNYEMYFYLCFALLAVLAARGRVIVLTLFFLAMHLVGLVYRPTDPALAFYTDVAPLAFCVGTWLGLTQLRGGLRAAGPGLDWLAAGLGLAGLVAAFAIDRGGYPGYPAFIGFLCFASGLIVLGLRHEGRHAPHRLALLVGDASYAIYLLHMFVVGALVALGYRLLPVDNPFANIAVIAACVLVSTIGGIIVHRLVELPLLRLMRGKPKPRLNAMAAGAA